MRGYFEIGIYHTKTKYNIGTLWRSAQQLGAAGIFTVGKRYSRQASDTPNVMLHTPLRHYLTVDDLMSNRPKGALLVGIEQGGTSLKEFCHPWRAIYLLGAEDHGLPPNVMDRCDMVVSLESVGVNSYNVAVAGSIVMYHRCFLSAVTGTHIRETYYDEQRAYRKIKQV